MSMSSAEVRKGCLPMRRYTVPLFACAMLLGVSCAHQRTPAPSQPTPAPSQPVPAPGQPTPSQPTPAPSQPTPGQPGAGGSQPGTGGSAPTPAPSPSTPSRSTTGGRQRTPAPSQPPAVTRPSPYVPSPPSPVALEALWLFKMGCQAEDFNDVTCGKAVLLLEGIMRDDPSQLDVRLAYADALWNQSFRQSEDSAESARLRQRSLELYQQLVDQDVPDARPYYTLSVLTRNPDTRLQLLRRALALEPEHPDAHKDMAWLLLGQGRTDEAIREYRLHLSLHPSKERADALDDIRFARRLGELGRIREAAEVYDAVWDALRDESRAERCQVFKTVDLGPYERIGARFAQRVRDIRAACSGTPRLEHAQELERQGQDAAAVQELERQIQENPMPPEPYLALERLYLKQGRADEAARVMSRYFQQEKDPQERCRHFRTLSPETARALDPALLGELGRTCRSGQP